MALFKQTGLICEDSIVHPDMNDVLNLKLGTSQVDYPANSWADKVAVLGEPLPSKTASGSIAHFTDGADSVPLDEGVFYFNPVQASGTPTPSSPIAIYGHTGLNVIQTRKNLFVDDITKYTDNGYWICPIKLKQGATYTLWANLKEGKTAITGCVVGTVKDGDRYAEFVGRQNCISTSGSTSTITMTIDNTYVNPKCVFYLGSGKTWADILDTYEIQLEENATATAYEPYTATTYPVSWSEHGTVYGGYYNSVTGELWKTHELDSFNGDSITSLSSSGGVPYIRVVASSMSTGVRSDMICNQYVSSATAQSGNITWVSASQQVVYIYDNRFTDLETAKALLTANPVELCYPLATPVLVAVIGSTKIKTFEGVNNIWNDGGGISEVGYRSKASGGGIPTFTETVICDNSALSTGTLTFTDDIEDYDILDFECYNADTQKITHYLTVPEVIMTIKNASSDYVNFNEIGTNQYVCYGVSSDNLTWTVRGRRNMLIKSVTGYVCSNMTVTKTEFYKRNSISPVVAVVEPVEDVLSYHYIFTASGDGANDQTQPCGMAMQIDSLFNDNSIGFFNRYNSLTAPIIAKSHSISCADAYGDNYWILCYYGLKFT